MVVAIAFWSSRLFPNEITRGEPGCGPEARQSFSREIKTRKDLVEACKGFGGPPNLIHFVVPITSSRINKRKAWLNDPELLAQRVLLEGRDWTRREDGQAKELSRLESFDDILLFFPEDKVDEVKSSV